MNILNGFCLLSNRCIYAIKLRQHQKGNVAFIDRYIPVNGNYIVIETPIAQDVNESDIPELLLIAEVTTSWHE